MAGTWPGSCARGFVALVGAGLFLKPLDVAVFIVGSPVRR